MQNLKALAFFLKSSYRKNQSERQRAVAERAVELYHSGIQKPGLKAQKACEAQQGYEQKQGAWEVAIKAFKNKIRLWHYSVKTMKAYSLWAEKSRYFSKEKPGGQMFFVAINSDLCYSIYGLVFSFLVWLPVCFILSDIRGNK